MDTIDTNIRQQLKKWAQGQTPPPDGKTRLLKAATAPRISFRKPNALKIPAFPTEMVSWAMVYSMDRGVATLRLIR